VSGPQSQTVMPGQSPTFSVTAIGLAPLSYQWSLNGMPVNGVTSSTLTLNNVQTNSAGSYAVVVTNPWGSVTSAVATLTVTNPTIILAPVSSAGMTSSGFTFQFSTPVACTYVIMVTTNLHDWTPVYTNVTGG